MPGASCCIAGFAEGAGPGRRRPGRLADGRDLDAEQVRIVGPDLDAAAVTDDQPERAGRHDRLPDLRERDVDRNAPQADEPRRGHVEVAAQGLAGVVNVLAALEGDGAAHGDDAFLGGEHHADPLVGLQRHDPPLSQAPARIVGRGLVRGHGVGAIGTCRTVHRRSMTARAPRRTTG